MKLKREGLKTSEAEKLLTRYGLNEIEEVSKNTPFKVYLNQIKNNFIVYLLFFSAVLSFIIGKHITAYTILFVIVMITTIGFVQEYRSEKAIEALKDMLVPISVVIRDGHEQEIESSKIVPGDILVLRSGEKIPADCVVLEENELLVNESALTGESKEVSKKISTGEKYTDENKIFMGTYIVRGKCVAKVIHTGMKTEFGNIASMISSTEKELPLQKKVNKIAKYMAIISVIISVLTGILMLIQSKTINKDVIVNILVVTIALSVSAFPEGFPVVLITTLSSGAYRLSKRNAIVNRMSIIETLGETTVICSDKTGTITKGEMTVKKVFAGDEIFDVSGEGYSLYGDFSKKGKKCDIKKEEFFKHLFNNFILCNDAEIERTGQEGEVKTIGSPTESAILVLGAKAGVYEEDFDYEKLYEIPFSSERKTMSVVYDLRSEKVLYSKGAIEYILPRCKYIQKRNGIFRLTEKERKKILETNRKFALETLRTIGFAYKPVKNDFKNHLEEDLIFSGFVAMKDPPREEVKESIRRCKIAGIKVKMITGDNKETALAIAREIGLKGDLMEGFELDTYTDEELEKIIPSISIFARVNPEHKIRIVKALKSLGEIVTMTGDGVNDAPALKEAHIGVAMGKNGTDVSRSVADLTLKDDKFSTIVYAVEEGRTIFKNIRKFVTFQLSCNFAELSILFFGVLLSPLLGWEAPLLLALHILFMNLVTDNLPAITLGLNSASKDSMSEKPRKNGDILNKKLSSIIVVVGIFKTVLVLLSYYITFNIFQEGVIYSRTVALATLIFVEIASAFEFRSFRKGVLTRSPFKNIYLFIASVISSIATFIIIYTPVNKVFETVPLHVNDLATVFSLTLFFLVVMDLFKWANKKFEIVDLENI